MKLCQNMSPLFELFIAKLTFHLGLFSAIPKFYQKFFSGGQPIWSMKKGLTASKIQKVENDPTENIYRQLSEENRPMQQPHREHRNLAPINQENVINF